MCCIDLGNANLENPLIAQAQRYALAVKLPLAVVVVVVCIDDIVGPAALLTFEKELKSFNIPLLSLIGRDVDNLMAATSLHLKPRKIFNDLTLLDVDLNGLTWHPYEWPGKIATVTELVVSGGATC